MDAAKNIAALFAPAKVLIVDDEPYMRKVIRTLLGDVPFDVEKRKKALPA